MEERKKKKNWKKYFLIDSNIGLASYGVRVFAGLYVGYISSKNISGMLSDGGEVKKAVMAASVLLLLAAAEFVISGIYAILKGEYRK